MGLIRVSDDAEKKIKEEAEAAGSTITTTVDKMLQSNDIAARLDKMGKWLEKKFVDLEAALDSAVLSNSYTSKHRSSKVPKVIPWPIVQDLMFDILPDGAEEWLPGMEDAAHASDNLDMGTFLIEDNVLISNDAWGKAQWLRITPRVEDYLKANEML